jgi:signal transduction histidine kinase
MRDPKMNSPVMGTLGRSDAYQVSLIKSPLRLLILLSFSIFFVELFVHIVLNSLVALSPGTKVVLDGLVLVILLSPMLFYFLFWPLFTHIRQRRLAEEALRKSDEQLRILSSHLLVAQEAERKRISIELHDDLGQSLTSLKLRLRFIRNRLSDEQTLLKEECLQNLKFIDEVIDNLRRLSRDLSPSILEDFGLTASLNRLVDDFRKYYNVAETIIDMPDIDRFFPTSDQILIYRIFQEALTNISKHSHAEHVCIAVNKDLDDSVEFRIEDDGRGFDLQKILDSGTVHRGLGISALRQRVRTLGGYFSINSSEGQGTVISFAVPMEKERR